MLKGMFSKVEAVCYCLLCAGCGWRLGGGRDWHSSCNDPRKRQMVRAQAKPVGMETISNSQFQLRALERECLAINIFPF